MNNNNNNINYINSSLELHLFFARIMKEHSLFLAAAFTDRNNNYKKMALNFQNAFNNLLLQTIKLADRNINPNILSSNELVTNNTLEAENKTSTLIGTQIDTNLTLKEINLKPGKINASEQLLNNISYLNKKALPLIKQLIDFKKDILLNVSTCKMFTMNYPLLINHILNEAKMYYDLLLKIENKEKLSTEYIYQQELFWNDIMKEHAEFIRGLLDPSEKNLIITANEYADNYEKILESANANLSDLTNTSLNKTTEFRDFKIAGENGILNCKIKSIIIPLLADHVVREANHFIHLLQNYNNQIKEY